MHSKRVLHSNKIDQTPCRVFWESFNVPHRTWLTMHSLILNSGRCILIRENVRLDSGSGYFTHLANESACQANCNWTSCIWLWRAEHSVWRTPFWTFRFYWNCRTEKVPTSACMHGVEPGIAFYSKRMDQTWMKTISVFQLRKSIWLCHIVSLNIGSGKILLPKWSWYSWFKVNWIQV